MSIFQSEKKKEQIRGWYERFRDRLKVPVEEAEFATPFGRTHALLAGPKEAPPLVVLHGAMASSAHVLGEMGPLLQTRRVYALDVIGQSVMSEDRTMQLEDGSYGQWVGAACDALGLQECDLYGVSWGGFVALQAVVHAPERVRHLVLAVPAGLAKNDIWPGLRDAGWPMLLYRLFPSEARFERVMQAFFTDADPEWKSFFRDALGAYKTDIRVPPIVSVESLAAFRNPALIFGAENDVNFPGDRLLARAIELFPQADTVLLRGTQHCPPLTDTFRAEMAGKIERFLAGGAE